MYWAWLGLFWRCHGPIHINWPGQVATLLLVYPGWTSELNDPNRSFESFRTLSHSLGGCNGCTGLLSIIKPLKLAVRALGRLGGPVQCLDKSFCRNNFHSTSSTTTFKIKISGESIQKECQIMIMKKFFGKDKKIKFVIFFNFLLIFKNV